jgi:hypothetical protein
MQQNPLSSPSAPPVSIPVHSAVQTVSVPGTRRSGTLCLFLLEEQGTPEGPVSGAPADAAAPEARSRPQPPYARFRLCRGFIDDLNRLLPIRLRIQLEGEISNGRQRGRVEGPSLRFRWEFAEA